MRILLVACCFLACVTSALATPADVLTIPPDLQLPAITDGDPAPGKRVLQALPAYQDSQVRHALYLPVDWKPGQTYPLIVEYTGNNGTVASGKACQGYGISGGKGFLWVCLPFVSKDGKRDMDWWWGDADRTAAYAMTAVADICKRWGGDPKAVILTGYSRGAIACNYIGLRNDDIAKLWLGMVPASHYDNRNWKEMDAADVARAPERLKRLGATPQYVCGEHHLPKQHEDGALLAMVHERKLDTFESAKTALGLIPMLDQERIRPFILENAPQARVTFSSFPWVNHTGEWILRETEERQKLRAWVNDLLTATRPQNPE